MKSPTRPIFSTTVILLTAAQIAVAPLWARAQEAASERRTPAPFITDVRLDGQGRLHASVVDSNGAPRSESRLEVRHQDGSIVDGRTDEQGRAAVSLHRGGVFLITSGGGARLCRVWTREAAPPAAQVGVLIVESNTIVRGNLTPAEKIYNFFEAYPFLAYTLAAAAITLPIVLIADDDDDAS